MAQKATKIGYQPAIASLKLSGLAKEVGPRLAEHVKPNQALLACGETEVVVTKPGKGGRNQDVVLSAIPKLTTDSVIVSVASDGKDNVNVAGAIGDGSWSKKLLLKKKLDPFKAVENNQSYKLLHKLHDHLFINKVTANISDFILVLRGNGDEN